MTIYCHNCGSRSKKADENYKCSHCGSGFVEVVNDNPTRGNGRGGRNILTRILSRLDEIQRQHEPEGPPQPMELGRQEEDEVQPEIHSPGTVAQAQTGKEGEIHAVQPSQHGRIIYRVGMREEILQALRVLEARNDGQQQVEQATDNAGQPNPGNFFLDLVDMMGTEHGEGYLVPSGEMKGAKRPMSKEEIDRLPTVRLDTAFMEKAGEEPPQCTICLDTMTEGETVVELSCKHLFHRDCIEPWLLKENTCSFCRKNLGGVGSGASAGNHAGIYVDDDDDDGLDFDDSLMDYGEDFGEELMDEFDDYESDESDEWEEDEFLEEWEEDEQLPDANVMDSGATQGA